jgi:hypothetical protein
VATLTFSYQEFTAVIGPLSPVVEPGCYDLCREHSNGFRVPKGWEVTMLPGDLSSTATNESDVMALANLIRRTGLGDAVESIELPVTRRKGHLAVLADPG